MPAVATAPRRRTATSRPKPAAPPKDTTTQAQLLIDLRKQQDKLRRSISEQQAKLSDVDDQLVSLVGTEELAKQYKFTDQTVRSLYSVKDYLEARIVSVVGVGKSAQVGELTLTVSDPFLDKEGKPKKAFKQAMFARYKVEVK